MATLFTDKGKMEIIFPSNVKTFTAVELTNIIGFDAVYSSIHKDIIVYSESNVLNEEKLNHIASNFLIDLGINAAMYGTMILMTPLEAGLENNNEKTI